jgi:uncharacterized protein YdaU (DUF1376 family)
MNFYPFHIGDYMSHTAHLEPMEDLAYRRMIDLYFVRESCLPCDPAEIAKLIRLRGELETVKSVLAEFFNETPEGWVNTRCDYEISEAQSKRMKAQASAAKRWDSDSNANAMRTHTEGNAPNPNPNPITNPITNPKGKSKTVVEYPEAFEEVWGEYPNRPGASKKDAFKSWDARLKSGVDPGLMLGGVVRYAAYCRASNTDPQYIKQPTTFFGPGEHYLSDWTPPASNPKGQSRHEYLSDKIADLTGRNKRPASNQEFIHGTAERVD